MDGKRVLQLLLVFSGVDMVVSKSSDILACSHMIEKDIHDAFGLFNMSAYVQLGLSYRIPCLAFTDQVSGDLSVYWSKLSKTAADDPQPVATCKDGQVVIPDDKRYSLANFSLIIHTVDESDGGKYKCEVNWITDTITTVQEEINIQVIGNTFPGGSSQASSTASFHPGRRLTLPCECASQPPDVVYWSMGEGVTTDTQIIGAHFYDGATLQIQHGADYSIGSDASLTINSLDNVQDTPTFWCHVFQSEHARRSCSTNVSISDEKPNIVLKASPTKYYLRKGIQQILPCRNWMSGQKMCGVQWTHQQRRLPVLSYDLFANTVTSNPDYMYDLATDFGLVIKSVNHIHTGQYTCRILGSDAKSRIEEAIDTIVIGDTFPASYKTIVMQESEVTMPCECAQHSPGSSILAVYWLRVEGTNSDSDVIVAIRNMIEGSPPNSQGYSISSNGSLTVSFRTHYSRFWCRVFLSDGTLSSCLTDVKIIKQEPEPHFLEVLYSITFQVTIVIGAFAVFTFFCFQFKLPQRGYRLLKGPVGKTTPCEESDESARESAEESSAF